MRLIFPFVLFALISCSGTPGPQTTEETADTASLSEIRSVQNDTCTAINAFEKEIRDGKLSRKKMISSLIVFMSYLKKEYYLGGGKDYGTNEWVFPLQGYTSKHIGGKNGEGYVDGGYDFLDGNGHSGHPAHDIFINDAGQDCLDDQTKKSVNVLSVSGGIVVAVETEWDTASNLRGGKYIWVYEPHTNSLYYYAHNDSVTIKVCDIVNPGDKIATVGRTGLNAYKKRSPTHLHFMVLTLKEDLTLAPVNPYKQLLTAKTIE